MEVWFITIVSLCVAALIKAIYNNYISPPYKLKRPPGAYSLPILGSLFHFRNSLSDFEAKLKNLVSKHGPMVALQLGPEPTVFIASHAIAHEALIQNGAVFSDRPPALPTVKVVSANQHSIHTGFYGPTWRILRRNLTYEVLHPTRIKAFCHARKWAFDILMKRLKSQQDGVVYVREHFQYTIFALLVRMVFGEDISEEDVKRVEGVERAVLLAFRKYNVLSLWPRLSKVLFPKKWQEFLQIVKNRDDMHMSLIRHRLQKDTSEKKVMCYVDTLLGLELPHEKRELSDDEIVSCASEFLNGASDTTSNALHSLMANLVKHPHIQERLFREIQKAVSPGEEEVKEEDLQNIPYVKALVLEGLRLHPPGRVVPAHAVMEDVVLNGYVIPKNWTVNFMVAQMGVDPNVWEDPLEFKPERFLSREHGGTGDDFDITGTREIKMMPFGIGRRMCPGYQLGLLHLEYFVANMVWNFQWKPVNGEEVDLTEVLEYTTALKYPLRTQITPRVK